MKHFRITEAATGKVVHEYNSESEIVYELYPAPDFVTTEVVVDDGAAPAYAGSWIITRYAFRKRLTVDEREDIEVASVDIPTATAANRKRAAALRVYMADLQAAEYVNLQNAELRNGVLKMQTLGLLAAGRAAEILDTTPVAEELYQ